MSLILNESEAVTTPTHNVGGFIYKGFSIYSMLYYLQKYSTKVSINSVNELEWHLYAHSEEHGEYDNKGTLSQVVSQAFEPHIEQAKADVKATHEKWDAFFKSTDLLKGTQCPLSR